MLTAERGCLVHSLKLGSLCFVCACFVEFVERRSFSEHGPLLSEHGHVPAEHGHALSEHGPVLAEHGHVLVEHGHVLPYSALLRKGQKAGR